MSAEPATDHGRFRRTGPASHGRRASDGIRLREIVAYCGALPHPVEHVQERFELCRSEAYRYLARAIDVGLLERVAPLRGEPALIRATREGMRYAGLGLDVPRVSPSLASHWLSCSAVALQVAREFGWEGVISAAELRFEEALAGRPIASATLGQRPNGHPHLHRPDLAILRADRPIAVEVELTPKAPERLYQIVRAWRRAGCVSEVRYFCAPGLTRRAVDRAIERSHAQERVRIFDLKENG